MSRITDDAPAHFLWWMRFISAVSKKIKFFPTGGTAVYGNDIEVN